MNTYHINNLTEDFEKKLSLYSQQNYMVRENNFFNIDRYTQYVNIIINAYDLDIQSMINRIENYYKSGIDFENGKLKFGYSDINMIASKLYKELWHQNNPNTLEAYINIIENRIDGDLSPWLDISFDDEDIKNNFLDSATEYIIEHQNIEWIKAFETIDYERDRWLRPIHDSDIPTAFENLNDLYFWLKNNRFEEILYFIGNSTVKLLLLNIIAIENYNPLYIHEYRIVKILKACKNDYITCGEILTHVSIKLNSILLTKFEYSLFAFLNLYNVHSSPNVSNENIDYVKEWQEMLANQLVNIFFKHFYHTYEKEKYSQIVFNLLNYLAYKYVDQYKNTSHYKGNYTLSLIFDKLSSFKISISAYEKISLFNLCIEDLIALQLEELKNQKTFSKTNYFLLSYYLKQIEIEKKVIDKDYTSLINNVTQTMLYHLRETFADVTMNNKIYIDFDFLEKIDFGLIYTLSSDRTIWVEIVYIDTIKDVLQSQNNYVANKISKSYFKILLIIFEKTQDMDIAKHINELAIQLGIEIDLVYSIFWDSSRNDRLQDEYFEIINIFDESLFNDLLDALSKQNNLKNLFQLLSHTISGIRQKSIAEKIEQVANHLDDKDMSYYDIRESISYASQNNFRQVASKLIDTYQAKISNTNYTQFKKEFDEVVCKKKLLDIYYSNDSKDEKLKKLDAYKITFNDKNWGEQSKQVQCENYKDFVRAIIFFEDEPNKTYKILDSLLDKELNSLYLINMVSAYFETFKENPNKVEKYQFILKQYEEYNKKFNSNRVKSLFEYQILLYGYKSINETNKIIHLYEELPSYYRKYIKDDLPKELQIFDSTVKMNSKLVVCVEGEFDIKFLKNINKHIEEYQNIIDLEKEQISFIDLGGSRLEKWVQEHHFEGSNILELHIYDSDIGAGQNAFKYQNQCEMVNNRTDRSICFLTKKREMENYIHKTLIEKMFKIDMSNIVNWDSKDIPTYILNKGKIKDEKAIKEILNCKLTKSMTKELLEDLGGFDEIKSWFEKIKELNEL